VPPSFANQRSVVERGEPVEAYTVADQQPERGVGYGPCEFASCDVDGEVSRRPRAKSSPTDPIGGNLRTRATRRRPDSRVHWHNLCGLDTVLIGPSRISHI
jgi:hypothetical protein